MIVEEEKTTETVVGSDIIISEPEGGKGNKYHKAKDGKFTSPDKGEGAASEAEAAPVSTPAPEEAKKATLSSILSKHAPKPTISSIINKHISGLGPSNNPNDWNNIISLKNYRKTLEQIFKANPKTDLTETQIINLTNKMNPIIKNAMLACNFRFTYILDFIKSNHILNQFSLGGRSGGYGADPESRRHGRCVMSHNTFGSQGIFFDEGLSREEVMKNRKALEKYGCLMDNNPYGAATNRIATQYGDTFWIMNDSVKDRTTFTIGDSLNMAEPTESRAGCDIPVPLKDGFNYRQLGTHGYNYYDDIMRANDVHTLTRACSKSYIEAQMHGELLIDRDIFGCCASPSDWESEKGRKAIPLLHNMGIKTFTHRRGNSYLEEIVLDENGNYEYRRVE